VSEATTKRKWQARIRNWIGTASYGLMVSGLRRNGRGAWLPAVDVVSAEAIAFLQKHRPKTSRRVLSAVMCLGPKIKNGEQLRAMFPECTITTNRKQGGFLMSFTVEETKV